MTDGDVCIYVLIDPRTEEIRYVGKSVHPAGRLRMHNRRVDAPRTYRDAWIKQLQQLDLSPRLEIVQWVRKDHWQAAERYWIAYYREIRERTLEVRRRAWDTRRRNQAAR